VPSGLNGWNKQIEALSSNFGESKPTNCGGGGEGKPSNTSKVRHRVVVGLGFRGLVRGVVVGGSGWFDD
jgi:hypothetical protein